MIINTFIDHCFSYVLSQRKIGGIINPQFKYTSQNLNAIKAIEFIFTNEKFLEKENITKKVDLLLTLCKRVKTNMDPKLIFSEVFNDINKNYDELKSYAENFYNSSLNMDDEHGIENYIEFYSKRTLLTKDVKNLKETINKIDEGKFENVSEMFTQYKEIVERLYVNMVYGNYEPDQGSSHSIECIGLTSLAENASIMSDKIEGNTTFSIDEHLLPGIFRNNSFEESRLYLFAGAPGTGKSQLLINLYRSFITRIDIYRNVKQQDVVKTIAVPFFFSLENAINETQNRLIKCLLMHLYNGAKISYSPMAQTEKIKEYGFPRLSKSSCDKIEKEIYNVIMNSEQMNTKDVSEIFSSVISTIEKEDMSFMKECPIYLIASTPYSTKCSDIIKKIEDCLSSLNHFANANGKNVRYICGPIICDYLDLFLSDVPNDLYRLELGHITMDLKTLSILYNVPVITVTQLNKYNKRDMKTGNSLRYTLDDLTESKKKSEHADFVGFIDNEGNNLNNRLLIYSQKHRDYKLSTAYVAINRGMHYMCDQNFMSNSNYNNFNNMQQSNSSFSVSIPSFQNNNFYTGSNQIIV